MAKRTVYNNLNRGEVSDSAVCRDDVKFINESASLVENFLPNRMGGMGMRPGSGYLGTLLGASYLVPFTRSIDDQALLEFSNNKLRFWVDDAVVARRNVNAGSALASLASWTLYGAGATTSGGNLLIKQATASTESYAFNYVGLHADDRNQEIGVKFTITQAPLRVELGTGITAHSNDLFDGWLNPGTYSFAVTCPAVLAVTFSSDKTIIGKVTACQIEDNVNLELTTTITTAMLPSIRAAQVNDVVFITADTGSANTHPQHKVMRFGEKSWGYAPVRVDDGPYMDINIGTITMAPAALTGDTTLTASQAYFSSSHVGALFKVASKGQLVTQAFTAASQNSNSIKVIGTGAARKFNFTRTVTGLWGTTILALQQSVDDTTWTDYDTYSTGVGTITINDGLDGQEMYYRLYTNAWDIVNTTQIDTTLNYPGGSITGVCRVTSYTSTTVVNIQVLDNFGSTTASENWYEGSWSAKRGYPTAVTMYEGRLWFAGAGQIWGSVSDAFESFDRNVVGDSTSIYRTIAFESSANVHWLAEAVRLLVGITRDEISVRSSSFNEIVTQTNANLKGGTGQGAADIDCVSSNDSLYYVQRAGRKVLRLDYNSGSDGFQPVATQMFHDTVCEGSDGTGIKRIVLAKQPDERLFVLLNDGTIRVFITVPEQEVAGWSRITTKSGDTFKDIIVIPGTIEDRVYVVAYRNSAYMLEKLALMEDAIGDASSYTLDSYVYAAGPTTSVSCSHLANATTVGVWANGVFLADVAISAGAVALGGTYSNVTVGLRYTAKYKSNKLSGFAPYSMLAERARVEDVGIIASNVVQGTLSYGKDFDNLVALPGVEDRAAVSTTTRMSWMDYQPYPFRGSFKTDSRVCLQATGPVTIHCLTYGVVESKDKQGGA